MGLFKIFVRGALLAAVISIGAPLLGAGAAPFSATEASAAVVRNIVVRGNTRIDAETIKSYVLVTPGKSFGAGEINESVKALYQTGLFSNVRIDQSGSSLVVVVQENAVVNSVRFLGNKKLKDKQLRDLVETKVRGVYSEAKTQADVEKIKGYYRTTGRAGAAVTVETAPLDKGRVDVTFHIDEGKRTGINDIDFVGNDAYSDRRLRSVIQTKETNWLSWFTKRDVYDAAKLESDQELLRRFYMRNGYADFRVLGSEVDFDEAKGRYFITFTVDEGPRYKISSVSIDSSIPGVSGDDLRRSLKTGAGRTFNSTEIEKTLEDMTIQLAEAGYAFAQVRPRGDRDPSTNTIGLTFLVDEGPRVYVERIEIRGNTKTRDYVIRREFDFSEGDAYNRVLADKVERRLRNLGFFKTVSVNPEQGSAPDRVVLVVNVEEQPTGDFAIAGGYSTENGAIAEISLTEKNFLGRGQYLKIAYGRGLSDAASNTFTLAFTEPYFMGRRMALGFDLYQTTSEGTTYRPYDLASTGGGVRLGLPITDELDLQLNYKIVQKSISNVVDKDGNTFIDTDEGALYPEGDRITSSLGYQLTYSTIDSKQDPHSGLFVRVAQDFAGVGGDARYVKTVADARYYHEVIPQSDIIGFVRVQGGNITGLGEDVAIVDNFFKGGETIRGFASSGLGARTTDDIAIGGKTYVAATAEVQFPLPIVPDDFGLRGALFADAGTVYGYDMPAGYTDAPILDDNTIRSSVGFSILWASPFGLLRGDFAQALSKADQDETQFFRFSAGTQF